MRAPGVLVLATDEAVRTRLMRVARALAEPAWPVATAAQAAAELRSNDGLGVLVADLGSPETCMPQVLSLVEDHPRLVSIVAVPATSVAAMGPSATRLRWLPAPWEDAVLLQALRDACDCRTDARELRRSSTLLRRRTKQLARADERARERAQGRTEQLCDALSRAQRASRDAAKLLACAAEQNDPALRGHGERVARRAAAIADVLGISDGERGALREACVLQATLLDGVGHQPADELSADERRQVEERVEAASGLAQALGHAPAAVRALVHARERWDGRGLPVGLRGAGTPLLARVVAVAEAHVALVQGRGGRRPARPAAAQQALLDAAGTALDPEIVDALLRVLWREERVARRMLEAAIGRPVMKAPAVSDALPERIRVVIVSATGLLRQEIEAACDEDFAIAAVADARAAEDAARRGTHALVVVADDLYNCSVQDLVGRVQLAQPSEHRTAVMVLHAHGEPGDLAGAHHAGADDVGRWPQEADIFRARVRSMVRTATLEASMDAAADSGAARMEDLRTALSQAVHLVNNSVAGISGRAQLAALTGAVDEAGLVPVCLGEARRLSRILSALHRLSEAVAEGADAVDAVAPMALTD